MRRICCKSNKTVDWRGRAGRKKDFTESNHSNPKAEADVRDNENHK